MQFCGEGEACFPVYSEIFSSIQWRTLTAEGAERGRQQPHLVIEPPFAIHSCKTDLEETSKSSTGLLFHTVYIPIPLQVNHWELRTTPSNQE